MLTEILQYLRNWFIVEQIFGDFIVDNGEIYIAGEDLPIEMYAGQHFRLMGSHRNNGVKQYPTFLEDEQFSGAVWLLNIDPAILKIADEIEDWQTKYGAAVASPYQSESYSRGAYSRSKGTAADAAISWKTTFADRLAPWRKA